MDIYIFIILNNKGTVPYTAKSLASLSYVNVISLLTFVARQWRSQACPSNSKWNRSCQQKDQCILIEQLNIGVPTQWNG